MDAADGFRADLCDGRLEAHTMSAPQPDASSRAVQPTFHVEWGGSADLTVAEIWPDGDAPENPTVADVIAAMQRTATGWGAVKAICQGWEMHNEEIEVMGPGSGVLTLTDRGVYQHGKPVQAQP